jgi:chemotaxis protein CheD
MTTTTSVLVGMADIHVLRGPGTMTCIGLGSCVAVCALDPVADVAGMAHVMLPEAFADKEIVKPGKFADTAFVELLAQMERAGADPARLTWALAGGAQVFQFGAGAGSKLDIGARNGRALEEQLRTAGMQCKAQDIGGNLGRTVSLSVETGEVKVRTVAGGERVLCNLRG